MLIDPIDPIQKYVDSSNAQARVAASILGTVVFRAQKGTKKLMPCACACVLKCEAL